MAVWEQDGCGTSTKWLRRIIEDFKSEGTKDINSTYLLTLQMNKINRLGLKEMFSMDSEATLEILVNCYGTQKAFWKFQETVVDVGDAERGNSLKQYEAFLKEQQGWLDRDQINEIDQKNREKQRKLEEENDKLVDRIHEANEQCNGVYDQLQQAKNTIIQLKAELFDAYKAGFDQDSIEK